MMAITESKKKLTETKEFQEYVMLYNDTGQKKRMEKKWQDQIREYTLLIK